MTIQVTQADRDAANKAFDIAFQGDTSTIDDDMAELFARHRQQADRGEVVAWMYERGEHRVVVPLSERASHMTEHGWTETPLYALPPAPEAGQ